MKEKKTMDAVLIPQISLPNYTWRTSWCICSSIWCRFALSICQVKIISLSELWNPRKLKELKKKIQGIGSITNIPMYPPNIWRSHTITVLKLMATRTPIFQATGFCPRTAGSKITCLLIFKARKSIRYPASQSRRKYCFQNAKKNRTAHIPLCILAIRSTLLERGYEHLNNWCTNRIQIKSDYPQSKPSAKKWRTWWWVNPFWNLLEALTKVRDSKTILRSNRGQKNASTYASPGKCMFEYITVY